MRIIIDSWFNQIQNLAILSYYILTFFCCYFYTAKVCNLLQTLINKPNSEKAIKIRGKTSD